MSLIVAAVISSTSLSVLFFLVGGACGWFVHKYKVATQAKATNFQPAPVYEDLPSTSKPQDREKAFELKENVAYGPVRVA